MKARDANVGITKLGQKLLACGGHKMQRQLPSSAGLMYIFVDADICKMVFILMG